MSSMMKYTENKPPK